jgi:hypothetical protein
MKSENDLTKLARWAIPGWVAILSFLTFTIVDIVVTPPNQPRIYPSVLDVFNVVSGSNAILSAILIAAAGVPLGFIIYQAYFYMRWNSPFSRDGLLSPLLPGRMSDLDESTRGISLEEMEEGTKWRQEWIRNPLFLRDHGYKWRYIELFFTEAAQKIDSRFAGLSIYARHRYLHEVMHTLGASIGAVYFGFVGYIFIKTYNEHLFLPEYLLATVVVIMIFFVFLHLDERKRHALEHEHERQGFYKPTDQVPAIDFVIRTQPEGKRNVRIAIVSAGAIFIFFVALVQLFANPIITGGQTTYAMLVRIVLSLVAIAIWILSKKEPSRAIRIGDTLSLSLCLALAILVAIFRDSLFSWIDWPFFSALFLFLLANLLLFQNRQNTKEDMLALEYYTLRRYLTEKQHETVSEFA